MTSERFMPSTQRMGGNRREVPRLGVLVRHLTAIAHAQQRARCNQHGGGGQRKSRTQHQCYQRIQPGNAAGGFGRGRGFLMRRQTPSWKRGGNDGATRDARKSVPSLASSGLICSLFIGSRAAGFCPPPIVYGFFRPGQPG